MVEQKRAEEIGAFGIAAQKEENAKEIIRLFEQWGIHLKPRQVSAPEKDPAGPCIEETLGGVERVLRKAQIVLKTEWDLWMLRKVEVAGCPPHGGPG